MSLASDAVAAPAADVTVDGTAEQAIALATERFGRLDVLVNNAGQLPSRS